MRYRYWCWGWWGGATRAVVTVVFGDHGCFAEQDTQIKPWSYDSPNHLVKATVYHWWHKPKQLEESSQLPKKDTNDSSIIVVRGTLLQRLWERIVFLLVQSRIPWRMMWCLVMKLNQIKTRHIITKRKKTFLVTNMHTAFHHLIRFHTYLSIDPFQSCRPYHQLACWTSTQSPVHPPINNFTARWLPGCWCYQTWSPNSRSLTHFLLGKSTGPRDFYVFANHFCEVKPKWQWEWNASINIYILHYSSSFWEWLVDTYMYTVYVYLRIYTKNSLIFLGGGKHHLLTRCWKFPLSHSPKKHICVYIYIQTKWYRYTYLYPTMLPTPTRVLRWLQHVKWSRSSSQVQISRPSAGLMVVDPE